MLVYSNLKIYPKLQIKVKMLVTQSCPTLYNPLDCSLPGSSVHGIVQARILQWVTIPSPGDLPNPGIKPGSPGLQADSLSSEALGIYIIHFMNLALYIILICNDTYM